MLPQVASGKRVALAVTQPRRSPLLPEVPTIAEAANLLRDEDLLAWYGLLVPARTPAEVVQALEKAVFAVLRKPDTQQRLTALGTDLVAMPSAPFAERMRNASRHDGRPRSPACGRSPDTVGCTPRRTELHAGLASAASQGDRP